MINKGQLAGLMKQAQQMQENMRKVQESLESLEVEGQSGAGLVKVVMTCKHAVKRVTIDPSSSWAFFMLSCIACACFIRPAS